MPQIFQVLCCYKCDMFQVHQVKKSNKWQCRVCNEKQSLKKAFKIGPSKDCRSLVQKLNMEKRGHVEEKNEDEDLDVWDGNNDLFECENKTSELYDYTERKDLSCSSEENRESSDSPWLEDVTNRFYSGSECCEEAGATDERDCPSENTKMSIMSHYSAECKDELPQTIENYPNNEPAVCAQTTVRRVLKHPLDVHDKALSRDATLPPFKKNRGFQIIKNAASKLN